MSQAILVRERTCVIGKLLVAFFRFIHERYNVNSLPAFGTPEWGYFLERIADAELTLPARLNFSMCFSKERDRWEVGLAEHDAVAYAFYLSTTVDPDTRRMRFDDRSTMGLELHWEFDELLEAMFVLGHRVEGFYEFN